MKISSIKDLLRKTAENLVLRGKLSKKEERFLYSLFNDEICDKVAKQIQERFEDIEQLGNDLMREIKNSLCNEKDIFYYKNKNYLIKSAKKIGSKYNVCSIAAKRKTSRNFKILKR